MADIGEPSKRNAEAIVANVHAMRAALQLSDNLDVHSVLEMHRALLSEIEPDIAGTWRGQQVWIGGTGFGPHEASFVPPHHDRVPDAMRDLMDFVARDDIPVLAHAALTHAQFETIHPFPDGNGRTGRALIHAMLRAKGMSREVTVPVSAGLLTEVERYFDALTAYRQGDPVPIVTAMAEASVAALINGRHLIADLDGIRERWESALTARRDAVAWRLANLLLRQPVLNVATASRELDVTGANVGLALRQLESAGVVAEFSGRTRNRLWQAREVLDALDDFAARAGRRRYG
ncbi:MAG: Fic family protein [Stackebrandtia sp.]